MAVSRIAMDSGLAKDKKIVGDLRYVTGIYGVAHNDTMLHRIQDFIDDILTNSTSICMFDVILSQSGYFRFSGYVYPGKQHRAGVLMTYNGYHGAWNRINGTDSYKLISTTQA